MPLSEDEERILTEIERHLYASDPALARQVAATANAPVPARRTQLAALGAAVALVATIALLSVNPLAAFVLGFLPMLACGWQLERALRRFGRHSAEQVAENAGVVEVGVDPLLKKLEFAEIDDEAVFVGGVAAEG